MATFSNSECQMILLTREQLYERVWAEPMARLSAGLGLSDVGLAKICHRANVPVPPRGYWAKKRAGVGMQQPPLPICTDGAFQEFRFASETKPKASRQLPAGYDAEVLQLLERVQRAAQFTVSGALRNPHPLVELTKAAYEKPIEDNFGRLRPRMLCSAPLAMNVSKVCIPRSLNYLDGLIKAIESLGGLVTSTWEGRRPTTAVSWFGEKCATIYLRERCRKQLRERSPRYELMSKYLYVPAGELVLASGFDAYCTHCRDTENSPLELGIKKLLTKWIKSVGNERIKSAAAAEKALAQVKQEQLTRVREAESERKRQAEHSAEQAVQRRSAQLFSEAESWHRSQRLLAYVQAVREHVLCRFGSVNESSELAQWLTWATQQADALNSLNARVSGYTTSAAQTPQSRYAVAAPRSKPRVQSSKRDSDAFGEMPPQL